MRYKQFGSLIQNHSCFILLLFLYHVPNVNAELILSAPPRESEKAGEQYYAPIAEYISKILGERVVYKHPKTWNSYGSDMRAGKYDIVFDGPHFAAWRIKKIKHDPVVRLTGALRFMVLAKKDDASVIDLRSLIGKKICGLASPNLGTVTMFSLFDNPIIQPEIVPISGGFKNVIEVFLNTKRCNAAVVRDKLYAKLPEEKRSLLKIVEISQPLPNQTITVSARIKAIDKGKIIRALTSPQGSIVADKLLERFSKKKKFFIRAKYPEYIGLEDMLEGVVWGW